MKDFMKYALEQAKIALKHDEVTIGAVVVKDDKVIARGYNNRQKSQNAIKHAEIIAIERACKKLNSWRLDGCDIYVTLEPCPMCAGAIANARINRLIYACHETTSQDNLCEKILKSNRLNHKVEMIFDDTYEKICKNMLSDYFKNKR